MERLSVEVGRVVCSTQGRDVGRYFVVAQVVDEQFVMLTDGDTRKLDHLKKKKLKHLHLKPVLIEQFSSRMEKGQLLDAHVRKALQEAGLALDQPLHKED